MLAQKMLKEVFHAVIVFQKATDIKTWGVLIGYIPAKRAALAIRNAMCSFCSSSKLQSAPALFVAAFQGLGRLR